MSFPSKSNANDPVPPSNKVTHIDECFSLNSRA